MGRPRKNAIDTGGDATTPASGADATELEKLARECGLIGCTPPETDLKLGEKLASSEKLLAAYQRGKAEHAYIIMKAIFKGAVQDGREKLLLWLAENSLKRNVEAQTADAVIDAMTPEQRRARIRELTKRIGVADASEN